MNNMIDRKVVIECNDKAIEVIFSKEVLNIGLEPCSEKDGPILYCYISPAIALNYEDCQFIDISRLESIVCNMKKKQKGKMVYMTSSIINNTNLDEKYTKASAIEKYNLALWNTFSMKMAKYNINCNVIEVGINDLFFGEIKNKQNYARRLLNRRMLCENDILGSLQFLFSEHSSYMVGSVIKLDGGLDFGVIPPKKVDGSKKNICEHGNTSIKWNLENKKVLVFGASSGIGRSVALELGKNRTKVILVARREERLIELKKEIGNNCTVVVADVIEEEKVINLIDDLWEKEGWIDGVVYSAGQGYLVDDLNFQDNYKKMNCVNFEGFINVSQKFANKWIEKGIKGSIVAISTVDINRIPSRGLGCYSATKSALTQYTKNYALSAAKYGIRANCVMPGYIETEMLEWTAESYRERWIERIPLCRLGKGKDVAGVVTYLLGDSSNYISGNNILIDGGYMLNDISDVL